MRYVAALILSLSLLTGCASTPPLVVSGESLKAVGTQFAATSTAITQACIAKSLTVATCDSFRTFAQKFKLAFQPAVVVQKAAMASGDKTMTENASAIVTALVAELGNFTALFGGK